MVKVRKYNKKLQPFSVEKLVESIKAAAERSQQSMPISKIEKIANTMLAELEANNVDVVTTDNIAGFVEKALMNSSYKDVAKNYITYRHDKQQEHVYNSDLIKAFKKKLNGVNIENSNANSDERSFSGRMNEAARVLLKDDALNLMSKQSKNNHVSNHIYVHDLDSYSSGQHNCFDRNTAIVTSEGIRTFKNFTDGEQIVVLAGDGEWRRATVKCYGRQNIQRVELEYHTSKKDTNIVTIFCTKDHRWYLKDGSVTTNLNVGDQLQQLPLAVNISNITIETKGDAEMWCLGYAIGNSCDYHNITQVILYDDKLKYGEIFEKAYYHKGKNINGKQIYSKNLPVSKQQFLTSQSWKLLSIRQKQLLFDGFIHANGVYKNGIVAGCTTTDERVIEFVKDISCISGYHVYHISHTTNYKKNTQVYCVDFITNQTSYWTVKSITPTTNTPFVWCVEEPITHSFTLAGGIVTGNCLSIPFDNLLENGVAVKQTDLRSPKSIGTAFQLIAVLMQVQSLQQFGGVSATHIDWTLVPYVRYSLIKNLSEVIAYEKEIDNEKIISTKIQNKLFELNKIPYALLNKKSYDEEFFKIMSDTTIDFIDILDKIADELMAE